MTGQYVVGWIKRGPSGVIGTNKKDAQDTVASLLEDLDAGRMAEPASPDPDSVPTLLRERDVEFVSFGGWQAIDGAEVARGEPQGRPRVKFTRVEEMIEVASQEDAVVG